MKRAQAVSFTTFIIIITLFLTLQGIDESDVPIEQLQSLKEEVYCFLSLNLVSYLTLSLKQRIQIINLNSIKK